MNNKTYTEPRIYWGLSYLLVYLIQPQSEKGKINPNPLRSNFFTLRFPKPTAGQEVT